MKEETEKVNENESEKAKATIEEDLKDVRRESVVKLEQSQSIMNITTNFKKTYIPPAIPTVSTYSTVKQYNAASLIARSTIDKSLSSSSTLSSFIDQSSLVLVDRPEPPANKAWCTSDKNPVLTVTLGYYIDPTAVSYQHSKWNGTIPDDAPKEYSVEILSIQSQLDSIQKPIEKDFKNMKEDAEETIENKFEKLKSTPKEDLKEVRMKPDE
ncbi:hypothetical protein CAEBREN_12503 [Caenorhabditis brenneri]|uniref:SUN domain-containing protein n=1 Tax=Caenorhabditis brenneri TaxID=135651 RepID=G0MG29_CAEBE|nr:hypothetical protein CAEBREN_12503 [Caenorhabditis brenneri]